MKKQVVVIGGGDVFETREDFRAFLEHFEITDLDYFRHRGWKHFLQERLGNDYDVVRIEMPNKDDAKYSEWKLWFEKVVPLLNKEVVLVGHSLGGIFLAKHLAENDFPKTIIATFLIAAPFDEKDTKDVLGDFNLPPSLEKFAAQSPRIILYHSSDDTVVPPIDLEKYARALPDAETKMFYDKGHFSGEEFPELIADIKAVW